MRSTFIINTLLLIIIAFLGTGIYRGITRQIPLPETAPPSDTHLNIPGGLSKGDVRADLYDVLLDKNPFSPDRSFHKDNTKTQRDTSTDVSKRPRLFGTILMGDVRKAILEDPLTKQRRLYTINETINGYRVVDIRKEKVILSQNGQQIEVKLREDKGLKPFKLKMPATGKRRIARSRRPPRPPLTSGRQRGPR